MNNVLQTLPVFEKFITIPEYGEMVKLTENSPWHREESVIRHTQMTIEWYNTHFAHLRSPRQQMLAKLALLFHDTGKPAAKQEKFKVDRGNYLSFGGHEQVSARVFENFMASNPEFITQLNMDWKDVSAITFMIENHLPFDLKKDKLQNLHKALQFYLGKDDAIVFTDVVQSDAHGRISDDADVKLARVADWVEMFNSFESTDADISTLATMYIPIGASGSGKSTWTKEVIANAHNRRDIVTVSLDQYRLMFYADAHKIPFRELIESSNTDQVILYRDAFNYAVNNDKFFRKFYNEDFNDKLKSGIDIILDNMNTSRKSRKYWINAAKPKGYGIVGVIFPISKIELMNRAALRRDKKVPFEIVMRQYGSVSLPWVGSEVDELIINMNNIKGII